MTDPEIEGLTTDVLDIIKKAVKTMNELEVEALISFWNSTGPIGSIERDNNFSSGYNALRKAIKNQIKEEN